MAKKVLKLNELFGQEKAKKTIQFHLDAFKTENYFPPALFVAEKGGGKTTFAEAIAEDLVVKGAHARKPKLVVNCAQLKTVRMFFDSVVRPHIAPGKDITIIFDECSELIRDIQMLMLSICNPNSQKHNQVFFDDCYYEFDFRKLTFMFCTTDPQRLVQPLIDRLERFDFEPYKSDELGRIVEDRLGLAVEADAMEQIIKVVRGNPRASVKLATNLRKSLDMSGQTTPFTLENWEVLTDTLGINPFGLSNTEMQYLEVLARNGALRLNAIAARLGMTPAAVQRDVELFIMRNELIKVGPNGRELTNKGLTVVKGAVLPTT